MDDNNNNNNNVNFYFEGNATTSGVAEAASRSSEKVAREAEAKISGICLVICCNSPLLIN